MKHVTIYTDGACSGNRAGRLGRDFAVWRAQQGAFRRGAVDHQQPHGAARCDHRARGAFRALLGRPVFGQQICGRWDYQGLGKGWRAKGWVKSDKKPAKNPELWGRLLDLLDKHEVRFHWVKGHADNPYNNRCDELAVNEYQKYK